MKIAAEKIHPPSIRRDIRSAANLAENECSVNGGKPDSSHSVIYYTDLSLRVSEDDRNLLI